MWKAFSYMQKQAENIIYREFETREHNFKAGAIQGSQKCYLEIINSAQLQVC